MTQTTPLTLVVPRAARTGFAHFEHDAMACTWGLTLLCDDPHYAEQVARAAFDEIDRLELELSRFVPDSDVAQINRLSAGQPLRIGHDASRCLQLAVQYHIETQGAFDVTVRSVAKWSPDRPRMVLDPEQHLVEACCDGLIVDLGGIGKGYALDRAVALVREWDIAAGLLHCGQSTAFALGTPPDEAGWRLALRDPAAPQQTRGVLTLRDMALSGSGLLLHGPHIVDPRTGQAAAPGGGAWAAAPTAAEADALSTAFVVMDASETASHCLTNPHVGAIVLNDEGRLLPLGRRFSLESA